MAHAFVLRGANVLDDACSFSGPLDVHVADGVVAAVGRDLAVSGTVDVDFSGLWLTSRSPP